MLNFHDPFVQFIVYAALTGLAIIVAILLPLWIYFRQKNKKEISYTLVSNAPIVRIRPSVADRIKIILDGEEIKEAQLVVIAIKNTGNVAVKREDYDEPITVKFPSRTILSADVLNTNPKNLLNPEDAKTLLAWSHSSVTLAKHLLNPKEEIQLSVLLKGSKAEPSVRARIVNGALFEIKYAQADIEALFRRFVVVVASIGIMWVVFSQVFAAPNMRITSSLPTLLGSVLVLLISLGVGMLTIWVLRKRIEHQIRKRI